MFYVVPVKSTVEISQNFVAFSEYMNFNIQSRLEFQVAHSIEGWRKVKYKLLLVTNWIDQNICNSLH